jgi:cytochrome c oxidase subunit 2
MMESPEKQPQRVLILSSHALFGEGLRSLLRAREVEFEVIDLVATVDAAIRAMKTHQPDIIIVDYDDESVDREAFMARFVEAEGQMRVVLLSLKEGKEGREAVVYDRRTLAASQMEDWLEGWKKENQVTQPVEREQPARRMAMRHLIVAGFLVIVVAVLLGLVLTPENLLPAQASLQAEPIDRLFSVHFLVIGVLFSLIIVFMLYSIVAFRRKKGETGDGVHIEGNTALEVTWTLIPLGTVIGLAFWGSQILAETQRVDPEAMEVKVIASQWSWRFEYPEQGLTASELVLPVNQQALLLLRSQDVIHSFWVPEFRVKQDALPGGEEMERELRLTPKETGEYKILCSELCGRLHSDMRAPVRILSQNDFDAWVVEQGEAVPDDPVLRGQKWSQEFGCLACHSVDGSQLVGPTWKGTFGSEEVFEDGTTTFVDEDYLFESIRNPGSRIVQGYSNLMPATIAEGMTDDQVRDVIEYIKSLE